MCIRDRWHCYCAHLQYLDGTMPDTENVDENDNVIVDWTKMCIRDSLRPR